MGVSLPPFELEVPIGAGGMGQVWRAVHAPSESAVAVKVIGAERAADPRWHAALRRELEAVAALDHPGVVRVLDAGTIDSAAAAASGGQLVPESPWFAMEHASGGSLAERRPGTWRELADATRAILDALAHAHARGVLHRDLKPANVLICTSADERPGLKLTDFGLAFALEGRAADRAVTGTPEFMAPEQLVGRWRDYGPWTDLYALGCLVWALATGAPVFPCPDLTAARTGHLHHPPPRFRPRMPVPSDLPGLLHRLLEKDPRRRPAGAAAVRRLLDALGPPVATVLSGGAQATFDLAAMTAAGRTGSTEFGPPPVGPTLAPALDELPDDVGWSTGAPMGQRSVVQVRRRSPPPFHPPRPLLGAGTRLVGLRPPPLVGRQAEQDALWSALVDVDRSGRAGAVVLRGPTGAGRTRLGRWLLAEALEVGAAAVGLAASWNNGAGDHGLPALLADALALRGLSVDAARERVSALGLPRDGGLAEAALRVSGADPVRATIALVEHLARAGPVVLLLDDAHAGGEAVVLADRLLARRELVPSPVLVILTLRDEDLATRPLVALALERVRARQGVQERRLGPLDAVAREDLVQHVLGLDTGSASVVDSRSGGNPQLVIELVRGWLASGLLRPTARGFALTDVAPPPAPGGLKGAWSARIGAVTSPWPADDRRAIEVAAALGDPVRERLWAAACAARGVSPPVASVDRLVEAGLATRGDGCWSFTHELAREAVLDAAAAAGERAITHLACAAALEGDPSAPWRQERLGLHRYAAREFSAAAPSLLTAAELREDTSDYGRAIRLLDLHDDALERAGLPPGFRAHAASALARARAYANGSRPEDALPVAADAVRQARRHGWSELAVKALLVLGHVYFRVGDLDSAEASFQEAREMGPTSTGVQARLARGLGLVSQARGALDVAARWYTRAHQLYLRDGTDRFGIATALNDLGDVARLTGDLDRAAEMYAAALAICEEVEARDALIGRLNLAMVEWAGGRYGACREIAAAVVGPAGQLGAALAHVASLAMIAVCAGHEGDWSTWDAALARLRRLLRALPSADRDVVQLLVDAGGQAAERDEPARARQAWELAVEMCRALDDRRTELDLTRRIEGLARTPSGRAGR